MAVSNDLDAVNQQLDNIWRAADWPYLMETNALIISFIKGNCLLIILVILLGIRVIPPQWAGLWKYNNNIESSGKAAKISFIYFIIKNLYDGVIMSIVLPLWSTFSFKNTITIIIFILVGYDVFISNRISGGVITLVGIAIITLYLERLIETGKSIKFLGGLISWEKDDGQKHSPNVQAGEERRT